MNKKQLNRMNIQELGREYWRLIKVSITHPQKDLASRAANTGQVVLNEFQRRLLAGQTCHIDDFKNNSLH